MNTSKISHSHLNEAFRNCQKGCISLLIDAEVALSSYTGAETDTDHPTWHVFNSVTPAEYTVFKLQQHPSAQEVKDNMSTSATKMYTISSRR